LPIFSSFNLKYRKKLAICIFLRFVAQKCQKYTPNNTTTNSAVCSVKTLAIISVLRKKLCLIERERYRCEKSRIPTAIFTFHFVIGDVTSLFLATILIDVCCLLFGEPGHATLFSSFFSMALHPFGPWPLFQFLNHIHSR
jgi:hypothetical protein